MYKLLLKIVGILTVICVVWWRMEGKPLPGLLGGDDADTPSGLVYGPDGEIDMSQVYGTRVEAPADAAAIVFSQIGEVLEGTERAAEIARIRQQRGCSFSTIDLSDCPDPAGAAASPAEAAPTLVTGNGGTQGSDGVVVFRPSR